MLLQHHSRLDIPPDRELVTVYRDDDNTLYCNGFGTVHDWKSTLQCAHRSGGAMRLCVHRTEPMPNTMLFAADWLHQLDWRAKICGDKRAVIARRVNDVVTLAFDVIGPTEGCHHNPNRHKPENSWSYQLYRMRWWDDENLFDSVLLGVWPD